MKILETGRLILRTLELEDAPFYLALVNDPSYIENINDKGIRTLEQARDAILTGPMAMQQRMGFALYLTTLKESDVPIGLCGLIKRDSRADVDIGYAFLPQFHGAGYAHEAAAAVVAYGKDILNLPRLAGLTTPGNARSERLLEKLGFRFEQLCKLSEDDPGTHLFGIELAQIP